MDPVTIGLLGSAGIKLGSSLAGWIAGRGSKAAQQQAIANYVQAIKDKPDLTDEDFVTKYNELDPSKLQFSTPQAETAETLNGTALAKVQSDPALREAQMNVINRYQQNADQGLTATDLASRDQLLRNVGTQQQGSQEAILQSLARRGQLGGGSEIAARLGSSGQAYSDAAAQAEQLAAANQQSKQAALQGLYNAASNLSNQDYTRNSAVANKTDALSQFNLQHKSDINQRNVAAANAAAAQKDQVLNNAYASNVNTSNRSLDAQANANKTIKQTNSQNVVDAAKAASDAADKNVTNANQTGDMIRGVGSALGDAATLYGSTQSDADKKKKLNGLY